MSSEIDVTQPTSPNASTAAVRQNFFVAASEITDLQNAVAAILGGRQGRPADALPLTGGALRGPLALPPGAPGVPALMLGAIDGTGLYRSGDTIGIAAKGEPAWVFGHHVTVCLSRLDLADHPLTGIADAARPTDALNVRTADARYAPAGLLDDYAQLAAEVAMLRRMIRTPAQAAQAFGMPTEYLSPPP